MIFDILLDKKKYFSVFSFVAKRTSLNSKFSKLFKYINNELDHHFLVKTIRNKIWKAKTRILAIYNKFLSTPNFKFIKSDKKRRFCDEKTLWSNNPKSVISFYSVRVLLKHCKNCDYILVAIKIYLDSKCVLTNLYSYSFNLKPKESHS